MLYMLDTDTLSYLLKGRAPAVEARFEQLTPSDVCLSAVSRAELQYGLKRIAPDHKLHLAVRQLFKLVHVLSWNADAADWYAVIRHQLEKKGRPIGEMDTMIAAHSLSAGAILVTNNLKHFSRIEAPLQIENWAK